MIRRSFMTKTLAGGALAVGGTGFLFGRRALARDRLKERLLDDALPAFVDNSNKELQSLPIRGREKILEYFHGRCLNAPSLATFICSDQFGERLSRCRTKAAKEEAFNLAFCERIASHSEILNNVGIVAEDIGQDLDNAWKTYCVELSSRWKTRLSGDVELLSGDQLSSQMSDVVKAELADARQFQIESHQNPALGETIGAIGKSAIMLLPLAKLGPVGAAIGIPIFLVLAAKHVWDYAMARMDDRKGEYQAEISSKIANMGKRIAAEFEKEVRQRITDLHEMQEFAIHETAEKIVSRKIGLI
jgi:hypothetical protein